MKLNVLFALTILLLASASSVAGQPDVAVSLKLAQASVLPGVPFDMTVTYQNRSQRPVALGMVADVIITPEGGSPVRFPKAAEVAHARTGARTNFDLEPGAMETGIIDWMSNVFLQDARVTGPGNYDVQLEISGRPDDDDEYRAYVSPVLTAPVRLTRVTPAGIDGETWRHIEASPELARSGSSAVGTPSILKYLSEQEQGRTSGYYPYALVMSRTLRGAPPVTQESIDSFRSSPAYPRLLVDGGIAAETEARRAEQRQAPPAERERLWATAAGWYEAAVSSGNTGIQSQAASRLATARDALEHARAERHQRK